MAPSLADPTQTVAQRAFDPHPVDRRRDAAGPAARATAAEIQALGNWIASGYTAASCSSSGTGGATGAGGTTGTGGSSGIGGAGGTTNAGPPLQRAGGLSDALHVLPRGGAGQRRAHAAGDARPT